MLYDLDNPSPVASAGRHRRQGDGGGVTAANGRLTEANQLPAEASGERDSPRAACPHSPGQEARRHGHRYQEKIIIKG
jgi:hypothetical protein